MTATISEKNTMTARRFFTEIQTYDLPAELLDYAANEIQKLDDAAQKRKEKPTKAQQENLFPLPLLYLDYITIPLKVNPPLRLQ